VTVRLFAALRELAGSSHVDAQGATVGEVVEALSARFGDRFAGDPGWGLGSWVASILVTRVWGVV